jgi:hypothetical protein
MFIAAVRSAVVVLIVLDGHLLPSRPAAALGESVQKLKSGADDGRRRFTHVWSREDGLGPQFNARSCHSCHVSPMPGGAGADRITMVQLSHRALDPTGGRVVRKFLIAPEGRIGSTTPPADVVLRKPPSLFGLGDLERVPEEVLLEYADADDRDGDGISGRLARVSSGLGRLGWKARFATIEDAVAAAFLNELGLTTSRYPDDGSRTDRKKPEVDDATWHAVAGFVRSLPPLLSDQPTDAAGSEVFHRVGCAACHRPTLVIPGERGGSAREIHPYTDLLLHGWALRSPTASPRAMRRGRSSARRRSGGLPARDRRISTMDGRRRFMRRSLRMTVKRRGRQRRIAPCPNPAGRRCCSSWGRDERILSSRHRANRGLYR